MSKLFERLTIPSLFSEATITNWDGKGDLGSERSSIIFPDEPQVYDVPGLHGSDVAYRFHARSVTKFPEPHTPLLADLRVSENYGRSIQSCIVDFGIDADKTQQIFGHGNISMDSVVDNNFSNMPR